MKLLHVFRGLLLLIAVLVFGACEPIPAETPVGFINERVPLVMVPICGYPTALTTTVISKSTRLMWAFSPTMQLVSSADSLQFRHAARHQGRFYVYDQRADSANAVTMPRGYEMTPCPEAGETLAVVKPSTVYLLAGKIVPVPPPPCKLLTERRALALFNTQSELLQADATSSASSTKLAGRYLGQSAHGAGTLHSPKHPDPVRLAQEREMKEVVTKSFAIGSKTGSTVEGIESGLAYLSSHCSRFDEDLRENPDILADFQNKIAKTLNHLPIPPKYTNPQLQTSSEAAFSEGFEAGVGSKKLQFIALNTAATVAILLFPNVYVATETLAAKAVRLALERLRNIPIYVPAMTNGAGFFLRLPKALPRPPVANVNPPSLPLGIAPPPLTARLPFGNLSRAAEFGVKPYNQLIKAIRGTNLQEHHVLEQRFEPFIQNDARMNLTVAVTDAEHQIFTNAWRNEIAYAEKGTHKVTTESMNAAARKVYKDYPAILQALGL